MGTWNLIKDGIVVNTIVSEQQFIDQIQNDYDAIVEVIADKNGVVDSNSFGAIGWSYDGKSFSAPPVDNKQILLDALTDVQNSLVSLVQANDSVPDQDKFAAVTQAVQDSQLKPGDPEYQIWSSVVSLATPVNAAPPDPVPAPDPIVIAPKG